MAHLIISVGKERPKDDFDMLEELTSQMDTFKATRTYIEDEQKDTTIRIKEIKAVFTRRFRLTSGVKVTRAKKLAEVRNLHVADDSTQLANEYEELDGTSTSPPLTPHAYRTQL